MVYAAYAMSQAVVLCEWLALGVKRLGAARREQTEAAPFGGQPGPRRRGRGNHVQRVGEVRWGFQSSTRFR